MYCYNGIFYRIWSVCGVIFLLGALCILIEKPWKDTFRIQKCAIGIILLVFTLAFGLFYASRIIFPNILCYEGEYIEENRNSRVAPPLPLTYEYIFSKEGEKNQVFYLDVISKKEIIPYGFSPEKEYRIYYDAFTQIIVKVEDCAQ